MSGVNQLRMLVNQPFGDHGPSTFKGG